MRAVTRAMSVVEIVVANRRRGRNLEGDSCRSRSLKWWRRVMPKRNSPGVEKGRL